MPSNDNSCCCAAAEPVNTTVNVKVDVSKIIKYISIAGTLIVAIIFCSKCCRKMLDQGLLSCCKK